MSNTVTELVAACIAGERGALARLLSMIEAGGDDARSVVAALPAPQGSAWTVGITGAPGAGKSTLTDRLVTELVDDEHRVGVLAIDPTSPFSGGAILGDRIRMQSHATDPRVFIRSMATRGHLGGLSAATPQAARLLAVARFAWVVIETVGVGQVEVEIAGHADTTLVVVNPGWGDAVQANKAGLMEIADIFVVNKADRPGATETVHEIQGMQSLAVARDWIPPVLQTIGPTGDGVEAVSIAVTEHRQYLEATGRVDIRRVARTADEVRAIATEMMTERALVQCVGARFAELIDAVDRGEIDTYAAATSIVAAALDE